MFYVDTNEYKYWPALRNTFLTDQGKNPKYKKGISICTSEHFTLEQTQTNEREREIERKD